MKKSTSGPSSFRLSIRFMLSLLNILVGLLLIASGWGHVIPPQIIPQTTALSMLFPVFLAISIAFLLLWLRFCRQLCFISLFAVLVVAVPLRTYIPFNKVKEPTEGALKVLSYNVYGFNLTEAKENHKYQEILDYIANSDADFVCLQEAYAPPTTTETPQVEAMCNKWKTHESTVLKFNTFRLLSRYPVIRQEVIRFTDESHGAVLYVMQVGQDSVYLVNLHLSSNQITPTDKALYKDILLHPKDKMNKQNIIQLARKVDIAGKNRAANVQELIPYLKDWSRHPLILCGDFNDQPLSYPHYQLTRILNDAYTRSGNGIGISYNKSGMYFRIDNILCSSHWEIQDCVVDNSVNGSDHYPISAHLKLKEKVDL